MLRVGCRLPELPLEPQRRGPSDRRNVARGSNDSQPDTHQVQKLLTIFWGGMLLGGCFFFFSRVLFVRGLTRKMLDPLDLGKMWKYDMFLF